jgi:hypothetical protein
MSGVKRNELTDERQFIYKRTYINELLKKNICRSIMLEIWKLKFGIGYEARKKSVKG